MKIIIIGGVAAGLTAAAAIKRVNSDIEVVVYEEDELISYSTCSIPYYISGEIKKLDDLILFNPKTIKSSKNIVVKNFSKVIEINKRKKSVTVKNIHDNKLYEDNYDKLIIATGASQIFPNIENITSCSNVFKVKDLTDAARIKKFIDIYKPKKAVIVGSGFVGIEITEALIKNKISVTLLEKADKIFPILPLKISEKFTDLLKKCNVNYHTGNTVIKFMTDSNKYAVKVITDKNKFETDMVIISSGIKPNIDLAVSSGIKINQSLSTIDTNKKQQTSEYSIYAAGDCTNCYNYITNKQVYYPLATVARKQGEVAGLNAAGYNTSLKGQLFSWSLRFMNNEICQTGLTEEEAIKNGFEVESYFTVEKTSSKLLNKENKVNINYLYEKKTLKLLGATLFGNKRIVERANIIATAIYSKLNLKDISRIDFSYSPPFNTVYEPVAMAAKKILFQKGIL